MRIEEYRKTFASFQKEAAELSFRYTITGEYRENLQHLKASAENFFKKNADRNEKDYPEKKVIYQHFQTVLRKQTKELKTMSLDSKPHFFNSANSQEKNAPLFKSNHPYEVIEEEKSATSTASLGSSYNGS